MKEREREITKFTERERDRGWRIERTRLKEKERDKNGGGGVCGEKGKEREG